MTETEQQRKMFIGGLSFDTTNESLKGYFSKYGEIQDSIVMIDTKTSKSRGFGFVTFSQVSMVDEVMETRPHKLDGREITPRRAVAKQDCEKPGAQASVNKIFVGGIKDDTTEEHLQEYFKQFGKVEICEVMTDRETKKRRGFGFVTFTDFDPVDKIVNQKSHSVNGHHCHVSKAVPRHEMDKYGKGGPREHHQGRSYEPSRGGADEYDSYHRGGSDHRRGRSPPARTNHYQSERYAPYQKRYSPPRQPDRYAPPSRYASEQPPPRDYGRYEPPRDYGSRYPEHPPRDYHRSYAPEPPREYGRYAPPPSSAPSRDYDRYAPPAAHRDHRSSADYYKEGSYRSSASAPASAADHYRRDEPSSAPPPRAPAAGEYRSPYDYQQGDPKRRYESVDDKAPLDAREPFPRGSSAAQPAPEFDSYKKPEQNGYGYAPYQEHINNYGPGKGSSSYIARPSSSQYNPRPNQPQVYPSPMGGGSYPPSGSPNGGAPAGRPY